MADKLSQLHNIFPYQQLKRERCSDREVGDVCSIVSSKFHTRCWLEEARKASDERKERMNG